MRARASFVYKAIGGIFLLLGVLTFLNLVIAWDGMHAVLWQGLGYCVADFAIAYGCFTLERFVLYAFAANTAALAVLWLMSIPAAGPLPLFPLVSIACSGILTAYWYQTRRLLHSSKIGRAEAGLFFLGWGGTIIYTGIIELHLI